MKNTIIKSRIIFAFVLLGFAVSSCDKVVTVTPTTTEGRTFMKILKGGDANPAPIVKNPIDFVPTPTKLLMVDLRRDAHTSDELNKPVNVTIKDDTAAVKLANPAYLHLPTSWYSIQGDGVKSGGQGGTYTFSFKPGEFAKQIYITIADPTLLNPSSLYALGFTITSADGGVTIKEKSVVVEIGAKNPWDGVYAVTGPMSDAVNPALTQFVSLTYSAFTAANAGAWELHLITTGATQCVMFDNTVWTDYFHPILSGTAVSGYGAFALVIDFNPANGTIAAVHNLYGEASRGGTGAPVYAASNTRSAVLDPSGANAVQGKDISIKYFMIQTNQATGTSPRTTFNEKWTYKGAR